MKRTMVIAWVLMGCVSLAFADDPVLNQLRGDPGYVDLSQIKIPKDAADVAEVTLGPDLLKATVSAFADSAGAGIPPGLLDGIRGIQIRSFESMGDKAKEVKAAAERIAADLQNRGWSRIIRVAEGDELVTIDMLFTNGAMSGLMIMAVEEDEVALVNLVGSLNLGAILQLASQGLDPAALDSLQKAIQQATGPK